MYIQINTPIFRECSNRDGDDDDDEGGTKSPQKMKEGRFERVQCIHIQINTHKSEDKPPPRKQQGFSHSILFDTVMHISPGPFV
mmetsp:Transcript_1099/g.1500  ORF Transcript_1099/g.1500 Transcript_1099/m.1500 type:complete len:84 (-) Transcript_1099:180-431(-)